MENAGKFWDKLAARYAKSPIRDQESYQKKLTVTQGYFNPESEVLEFGCGTGSTAILHAPHVRHLLATDISANMLEIGRDRAKATGITNISFQQGTLDSLPLQPESFDVVLGLNILHLLEDREAAIARVSQVLKPGGVFVSSTALIAEMPFYLRMLVPLMQLIGKAPYLGKFSKEELVVELTRAGFSIDYEWRQSKGMVFIVARKSVTQ